MGTVPKIYKCKGKCAITAKPDPETLHALEEGFRILFESESESLLKKHLTREIFDSLKLKKTKFGSCLLDCIQSGIANLDSSVGIYAPDPDAYIAFDEIFDPIIEEYHGGFSKTDKQPPVDFGDFNTLTNVDPTGKFVLSTRVRCGRTIAGFPFNPCLTEDNYKDLEKKIAIALSSLEGDLKGTYYPLCSMDETVEQRLIEQHYLFKKGDKFLEAANSCRFWPTGRGIYYNEDKTFLVWVNEEDHLRIISMQKSGNLLAIYKKFVSGIAQIEKKLSFVRNERLGYLTFCPTNLGTSIRASVHIKIPKLALPKNKKKLNDFLEAHHLQMRGTAGEHSAPVGGIYDISNKQRMGLTEYNVMKTMHDGIKDLIKLEKSIKIKKKPKPSWRQLARRRLMKNHVLERLKWPPYLPAFLYKA